MAAPDDIDVEIESFGPDPKRLEELSRTLLRHEVLRGWLKRGKAAVLAAEFEEPSEARKRSQPAPPERFVATIFDYSANRTLLVSGDLDDPRDVEVDERGYQPLPSPQEFQQAAALVGRDERFADLLSRESLRPYRPVPPIVTEGDAADSGHRIIAVGLVPARGTKGHQIVGVDMIDRRVFTFEDGAPQSAVAHNPICGQVNAAQATASKGTGGQVWVNVTQGGTRLW